MKSSASRLLFLSVALTFAVAAPAADLLPSNDAKKLADRYALTKARIQELLGARLNPQPVSTEALPNPFYRPLPASEVPKTAGALPQAAPSELNDEDMLAKHAPGLKLSGYLVQDGVPHVTINGAICKAGDTITVGSNERPIFLHVVSVTPQEVTLGLNQATYTLQMKK